MTTADKIGKAFAPASDKDYKPLLTALVNKIKGLDDAAKQEFLIALEDVSANIKQALENK